MIYRLIAALATVQEIFAEAMALRAAMVRRHRVIGE
jgi:hypothetical protein